MTAVSVAGAWTELINKLDFKRGCISLLGIELGTGELSAVFDLKLGSKLGTVLDFKVGRDSSLGIKLGLALGNKLKCRAVVIAITKNIINSFKLGTILGIALGTEMRFKLGT